MHSCKGNWSLGKEAGGHTAAAGEANACLCLTSAYLTWKFRILAHDFYNWFSTNN